MSTVSSSNMGSAHNVFTSFDKSMSIKHPSHGSTENIDVQHLVNSEAKSISTENVPTGYILSYVTHGNRLLGSYFSDTHTHLYVASNAASSTPASTDTIDILSRILKGGFCFACHSESPRRVSSKLEVDIARLKEHDDKYKGFVHIKCGGMLPFMRTKRLVKKAAGI
ncbi:hypothetical protein L198_08028 [Cryptococcus wingfieldii CBS 7118]|uniref:Uncharacterized protein n=1 Tax=Cryptococcus wingfieldii CBS 7118 TaxID=1295528 RepID=A0A1E3HLQ4_9TREE|nr:hypothetical protein L198_08028 [Cryptococcus wingfieldii CBS 7118]ODN77293.1 hypothetical protein L198_08028 [Cryptococcus wingfieldii CBS 7118]